MIKKVSKFLLLFLALFGIVFSNVPFYAISFALNAYIKSYNIVDKAWHLQKDPNVVDTFSSLRNLTEQIKIPTAWANTSGAQYPTLGVTIAESPWLDNNWTTPTNVYADDAATAYVIAASFDSPDQTYVLKATGFDFSAIPDGSTINGVTARMNAWYRSGQGAGAIDLCQLLDVSKAKVGTNQCATQVALTTTNTTIITKGSASDTWGNALDTTWIKDPDFGIAIGIKATAANADVDVDYVTLEIDYTPPANTTTIADGTDPGDSTVAPSSAITDLDAFTLVTSGGTDSVTALTVTLTGTNSFESLSEVRVTSDNGATLYFSAAANPASNTVNFSGGTPIPVSTSATQFKVRITPKTHANMPVPPGLSYAVGGTVTAFTSTNTQAGNDATTPATITVDNLSPNGATSVSGTAGDTANTINWTTSNSGDFETTNGSVILRWASGSAGAEVPAEGNSSYAAGNTITTATVACVISSAASAAQSKIDGTGGSAGCTTTALTNGQAYTYKAFQRDTNGNYDVGVLIGTFTPSAPANTTTIADGTDPSDSTVAPSAAITDLDAFTLVTSGGTDSVTALTVTLTGTNSFESLSEVRVTSDNGATLYFSAAANPASNTVNFSGGTPIPVSTSATQFKVRITPKTHANMPVPPGLSYAVGGTVTAFTSTNTQAGNDATTPATITVDNLSPAGTTGASAAAENAQVTISWTNPGGDFQKVIIYCKTASITEAPTEGADPAVDATACDATARVKYSGATSPQTITGLTNGTTYYFRIYARDTNGNFTANASTQQVSATPGPTITSADVTAAGGGGCPTGTTVANTITSARQTDTIRINGTNFGATQGGSTVTVNGSAAVTVGTWTATVLSGIAVPSDAGNTGNIVVTVGSTATFAFTILPRLCTMDVTASSAGTPIANGVAEARQGDTIRFNGDHFGATQGAGGLATVNGANVTTGLTWSATVISGIVVPAAATDTGTVRVTRDGGDLSNTKSFTILPSITGIIDDFGGADDTAREYSAGDNAANNTTADLKDGEIQIDGNHFGSSPGTVTILGQSATPVVVGTRCGGSSWTATCIVVRVPTTIGNGAGGAGDYVGSVVVDRGASILGSWSGFRILPRISAANNPDNGVAGDTIEITGDHFCQNAGSCPVSPNRSSAADNVKFGSTQALDGDFQNLTGAGVCAGAGAAWTDTEICVKVPAGTPTGSQATQVTSTASAVAYTSNTQAFTVNSATPVDPGNLKQSRNSAFTDLIATGGAASSTPVYFSADTSSSVTGGTMYLQVEMRPVLGSSKDFDASNNCAGNAYCFEGTNGAVAGSGAGSTYNGGTITLTTATTSANENYHWRTRVRYYKAPTDYYSGWIAYGGNSENAIDLTVDTIAPSINPLTADTITTNTAHITWNTTGDSSSTQLAYGTNAALGTGTATTTETDISPTVTYHEVNLSNLTCYIPYYYRARSRDNAGNVTFSAIQNFTTGTCPTNPAKTTSFHIAGATGLINNGSPGSYPFTVSLAENGTSTKSVFVELAGVYDKTTTTANGITVQVNSQAAKTYVLPPIVVKNHFKIIYQVSPLTAVSNTLSVTPPTDTTVYVTSAKITVTYMYDP